MKYIIKPTLILGTVALISGIILAFLNNATFERIEQLNKMKQERALNQVLPGYKNIKETKINFNGNQINYWTAENSQGEKGFAYIVSKPGYSGDVITMVGVNSQFIIEGIYILQQTETPGLGARCEEISSDLTFWDFLRGKREKGNKLPWFQEQFSGINISKDVTIVKQGNWNPKMKDSLLNDNAITSITGATITSSTVKSSIESSVKLFQEILKNNQTEVTE